MDKNGIIYLLLLITYNKGNKVVIITADIQYKPQQEIVRNISMMQVASKSKDKKPNKEQKSTELTRAEVEYLFERMMMIDICKKAVKDAARYTGNSNMSQRELEDYHSNLIINILVDRGTYAALELANEFVENDYKLPKK